LSFDENQQFFEGFQNTNISPYLILEISPQKKKPGREPEVFFFLNSKHLKKNKIKPE
jgi:hypothetical protein